MSNLIKESPGAQEWLSIAMRRHSTEIFGELVYGVVWADDPSGDGEYIVPVDPTKLVEDINGSLYMLYEGHDPGKPKGRVVESEIFKTGDGRRFVAAVIGYYAGGNVLHFEQLGLDIQASVTPPSTLPNLPDGSWVEIAVDPREVKDAWLEKITSDVSFTIQRTELSHNAAEVVQELIRVGVPYVVLVWNPFVTVIAKEAGKDVYAAIHKWLRRLKEGLSDCQNPVLEVQSHQNGCAISFLYRGRNREQHYAAHDQISDAAVRAARLTAHLKVRGTPALQLIYEFDKDINRWYPLYAVLTDGTLITDDITLIAIEQLPKELSLGVVLEK